MTTSVEYPGPEFPNFPKVELTYPTRWGPLLIPDALLAVAKDPKDGEFRPNVVVAVTRQTAQFDLVEGVDAVLSKLASLESHEIVLDEMLSISGYSAHRTEVTFTDPRVGTLAQATYLVAIPNGAFVDLLQMTGSCSASQIEETFGEIREILQSVSVSS